MNNQIRFHIYDGAELVTTTEWSSEQTRDDAGRELRKAREQHGPQYSYRIERTGDSKQPNASNMIRFQIKVGELMFFSKAVPESERDTLLATLRSGKDLTVAAGSAGINDINLEKVEFKEVRV